MRDLIRPNRTNTLRRKSSRREFNRSSRNHYRRKKSGWFFKFLWRLFLFFCVVSALIMTGLRFIDPPTSSFIELNKLNNNPNINQQWVDMENVSLYFPLAVVASEDQQFPNHYGFDFKQIKLVLQESENGLSRGASTLTQQTVKNLFLWPNRSLLRKGIEAWFTLWMELIVPKRRILEIYINYAQFGKSIFGIEAASQTYFGIPPLQLTPGQSALIAATLPTPSKSNPAKPSEYLNTRSEFILDQMPRIGGRQLIRDL